MNWQTIRLELARCPGFPQGSASRSYLLHVPLDEAGHIDEYAARGAPALTTVRRYWPNERDQKGYLIRKKSGWAFSYALGDADDEDVFHLETHPFRTGEYITVAEPDGSRLPYRVASCQGAVVA